MSMEEIKKYIESVMQIAREGKHYNEGQEDAYIDTLEVLNSFNGNIR